MSIKHKIALLFALLVSIIFSLVSYAVYYYSKKEREDSFRLRLKNRALNTAKIASLVRDTNYALISGLDTGSVASLYDKSIIVLDREGQPVYAYADKPGNGLSLDSTIILGARSGDDYPFVDRSRPAIALQFKNAENSFIVAVAATDGDGEQYLDDLKRLLLLATLASVLLSYSAGVFFAKILIKPVRRITEEVNLISGSSISQRLYPGNNKDELYKLAQTFNNLLDRLQESFIIQRRFISNASHELSTPLTALSSQLDVTLYKERSATEYKEVLLSIQEDVKDLQQLTHSLLGIAKIGTEGSIDLSEVRVDEILLEVAANVQKLNPSYKVSLNFSTDPDNEKLITVFGNRNLLFIALRNVIENGCKYSDDHCARVQTSFTETTVRIDVASKGDVIVESDIQNIFQPFFRTDSAKPKQGSGLGLTLTRRILSLHKATIDVISNPQSGTVFSIVMNNSNAPS
ncbi:MAG: HAMP domain-containing sensor histidine kinase [Ferruginibacter sp.]